MLLLSGLSLFFLSVFGLGQAPPPEAPKLPPGRILFYVGTYTDGVSEGIYPFRLDRTNGELQALGPPGKADNPSYLAVDGSGRYLYAVNEISRFRGQQMGAVSAYSIDPRSGRLKLLNQVSSGGPHPCHIKLDTTEQFVLVANYTQGSVAVLPLREDGSLEPPSQVVRHEGSSRHPTRQKGPHAHCVLPRQQDNLIFVADLGLDRVLLYELDRETGTLTPRSSPSALKLKGGSGPRHVALEPSGKYLYVLNELDSTVTSFEVGGRTRKIGTESTLPRGYKGRNTGAGINVSPSGRFLYVSNRGHNSIAVFGIQADGRLKLQGHQRTGGRTPRGFGIDPTGEYLIVANQDSDNIVVFRITPETGLPEPTGTIAQVPRPACITFLPESKNSSP